MPLVAGTHVSKADREGPQPEKNRAFRRWLLALRNALGTGLGSVLLALPLKYLGLVPEEVVVRLFAIVTILSALVYGVRTEMHVQILMKEGSKGWAHELIVALEVLLMLAFLAFGPYCMVEPDGLFQFFGALALFVAVFVLALAAAWLDRAKGVKTGTAAAPECNFILFVRAGILEPADYIRFFRWLNERWDMVTPRGKVSYLSVWLCAALFSVASANGPAVAPVAYDFLKGKEKVTITKGGDQEDGKSSPEGAAAAPSGTAPIAAVREAAVPGEPAYHELCPGGLIPGDNAPEPQRLELYRRWLAGGLGAIFAGCARLAHRLPSDAWYAPGYCDASVRSLAWAPPVGEGAIVLWDSARFALARAEEGTLLGVTSSELVEEGEVYTVQTEGGTSTFLRNRLSEESSFVPEIFLDCRDVEPGAPYLRLPPALSRLWSSEVEREGKWIWPVREGPGADGGRRYEFEDPGPGDREIVGYCRSDLDCEFRVEGVVYASAGAGAIDIEKVLEAIS